MGRTCGEPDEIKKNTHPKYTTALFREQVGFALQPETAIRGECPVSPRGATYDLSVGFTQSVQELARACRGHPSVFSYSLMNECDPRSVPALLDNISAIDSDVPFVWNDNKLHQFTRYASRAVQFHPHGKPISSGSPHVRPMGVHRTCGT